jgi:hypothetical protein
VSRTTRILTMLLGIIAKPHKRDKFEVTPESVAYLAGIPHEMGITFICSDISEFGSWLCIVHCSLCYHYLSCPFLFLDKNNFKFAFCCVLLLLLILSQQHISLNQGLWDTHLTMIRPLNNIVLPYFIVSCMVVKLGLIQREIIDWRCLKTKCWGGNQRV